MEAFYFGESQRLFGIFHPPQSRLSCGIGVVCCYPIGHEYFSPFQGYHRAYVQLACMLAEKDIPVLRFDYYGTGDSYGESEEGSITQWLFDIGRAIDLLKLGSDLHTVCLIGCRMGGTLALLTGANRTDISSTVLWDPIINGQHYLANEFRQYREWLHSSFGKNTILHGNEIKGFPINPVLDREIREIDLVNYIGNVPSKMLIIEQKDNLCRNLTEHWCHTPAIFQHEQISWDESGHEKVSNNRNFRVPLKLLHSVVNWIEKEYK